MKLKSSCLVLCILSLMSPSLAYLQSSSGPGPKRARTVEDYKPRALKELETRQGEAGNRGNKEETMIVTSEIVPSRVNATYTGSRKPIPEIKKEVLRQWARLYAGAPEFYTKPYETELLFLEGGKEHWLAVKKELIPLLEEQLKKGDAVDLYLIRVGAAKTSAEWELMLLVENFKKPDPAKLRE